ncbi:MAG: sugar phosphate isomerase/epimerase [Verrucomicrobia bacterium]|jgi:sugar phosphate isomerase/epimerase|nr:sugar phosphate isomerase/epimerase [Verrucomicrobiota bacterium]
MKIFPASRGLFLGLGAAVMLSSLTVLGAGQAGIGPSFKGPLGLQLYSLRDSFKADVPGTLRKVRDFGFRNAELAGTYGLPPAVFRGMLAQHGIKPIAGHWSYEQWRDQPEAALAEAKALGVKYAGCAWIPHDGDFDEQECRAAIAVFNRAGKLARQQGIRFFYHIHGYEFHPHGDGTLFDLMMAETNPRFVTFEMDIFWVVFPAQDPVKLLEKYGKRWELMHLKDMKQGLELGSLKGGTDVRNDVALGTGQINMPAVLRAARKAGVKWYFIEDESPLVEEQIPVSLRFLETVKF